MASSTQGKAKFISKGSRISCNKNKRNHPMDQKKFLNLIAQGGNRVENNQIQLAMVDALVSPKANPDTVKAIIASV